MCHCLLDGKARYRAARVAALAVASFYSGAVLAQSWTDLGPETPDYATTAKCNTDA